MMSIFGALDTAVSGLTAQSDAFSNISDDVANSQTVGFKGVSTAFIDYLTTSTADLNNSGAVVARPVYTNNVQGTITQSTSPLALAISGQGFFPVSLEQSTTAGTANQVNFASTPTYTRSGDFALDKNGYIVNSAGEYLNGWTVSSAGVVDRDSVSPIQINQGVDNPVPTANVTLSANLPATPAANVPVSTQINVYDALGQAHTVTLNWTQNASNDWTATISSPDDTVDSDRGSAEIKFGSASGNTGIAEGTIGSINPTSPASVTTTSTTSGSTASLTFTSNFGEGDQTLTLNLGTYGGATGLTQFAGTAYTLNNITQDGVPPGTYTGVSTTAQGDIVVNYDNGQARTVARVPVVTFNNPDDLQRQDGQAYTATEASGVPRIQDAGTTGAGTIVTTSVEQSNVDIATQFTSLIIAQQAYSANTKVVTTANTMLQDSIDMLR